MAGSETNQRNVDSSIRRQTWSFATWEEIKLQSTVHGCSNILEPCDFPGCVVYASSEAHSDWLQNHPIRKSLWLVLRASKEGRLEEPNSLLHPCLGNREHQEVTIQVPGLPFNIWSPPSTSRSPHDGEEQPCWHSLRHHSYYSGAIWKCGNRQCNIFSLNQIRGRNVHQDSTDKACGGFKICLQSL